MFLYNLAMLLNEKKIIYQICEKKFLLDYNLKVHMRIHNWKKPYCCTFPGCFKKFSQSSNLNIHYKRHFNKKIIDKSDKILNAIENDKYSGSLNINNLNKLNSIYEKNGK